MSERIRKAKLYKSYFKDFYKKLDRKSKAKVDWTIQLIEYQEYVPIEYFKKLKGTDDIWEIRIKQGSKCI